MNNIAEIRRKNGIKQSELADLLEISKANYSKKERGLVKFTLEEAFIISKRFAVSIEQLFPDASSCGVCKKKISL